MFKQPVLHNVMKVSCDATYDSVLNVVIITITWLVLMNVPVLLCPTLTMCVYVQLELPEAIVKMVSRECMVFLCVYSCFHFD